MVLVCVAALCSNSSATPGVSLHQFPKEEILRNKWTLFVKSQYKSWPGPTGASVLCSKHFRGDQFVDYMKYKMGFSNFLTLKHDAVPTIHSDPSVDSSIGLDLNKKRIHESLSGLERTRPLLNIRPYKRRMTELETKVSGPNEQLLSGSFSVSKSKSCQIRPAVKSQACNANIKANKRSKGIMTKPATSTTGTSCKPSTRTIGTQWDPTDVDLRVTEQSQVHPLASSTPLKMKEDAVRSITSGKYSAISTDEFSDPCEIDSEYIPSNISMQELDQTHITQNTPPDVEPAHRELKFLVFTSCLEELLGICPLCHSKCSNEYKIIGSAAVVKSWCTYQRCSFRRVWNSQPMLGNYHAGNILMSAAILYSGCQFGPVSRMCEHLNLCCINARTFARHQKEYLVPVINNAWEKEKEKLIAECQVMYNGDVKLAGDGRADSPGHCAKYGSYSMMELQSGKIMDIQLVQSNEVKSSYWMEGEGLRRSVEILQDHDLHIVEMVTDRHKSNAKWLKVNLPATKHYYDIWHIAKGLSKKLDALYKRKGQEKVRLWKQSIINHLYWCAASTPSGDGNLMLTKWNSLINHMCNIHRHGSDLFPECLHDAIQTDRKKLWLEPGEATESLVAILESPYLLSDVQHMSPIYQTSGVEGYHSTILHFAPKHTTFSYLGMSSRLQLAALHFNENVDRPRRLTKDGKPVLTVRFPKSKKGTSVRHERTAPTYEYARRLMSTLVLEVGSRSKSLSEVINSMNIPPPLTQAYSDTDREDVKTNYFKHRRYNKLANNY